MPLCRDCHTAYDDHELDVLPALLRAAYFEEIAHVISAHRVSPARLLARLSPDACPRLLATFDGHGNLERLEPF